MSLRAVVLGGTGLVGSHLVSLGRERGAKVIATAREPRPGFIGLDVTNAVAMQHLIARERPDVVFFSAADANVDKCERQPAETARVNVEAVGIAAMASAAVGALFVHYSSDYVFDGASGPYAETDAPRPICEYGAQKVAAERVVAAAGEHLILRTTVVYGTEPAGKNFLARLISSLRGGSPVRVPIDQVGSPTLVDDVAAASWEFVEHGFRGLYHVAGRERMDRYTFAVMAARAFGLDPRPVQAVTTAELAQLARRPLEAGMVVDKAERDLGRPLIGASAGLGLLAEARAF